MKKRTVYLLIFLLIVSNLLTFRVTRNAYRWNMTTPPPAVGGNAAANDLPEELRPFVETFNILAQRHLDEVAKEELIDAAIKGMVDSLGDPQTSFLDAEHWEEMMMKIDGSFSGIGIEINVVNEYITIIAPIKNTPGERAGLLPGDRIVAVDGASLIGATTMEAVKLMRGPTGTEVTLTVERDGLPAPLTFEITRGDIVLPSVFPEMLGEEIGYIEITTFDEHTGNDFREALLLLESQGMKGLILDLRDNPGGLLDEAIKIGQELLPAGPITHVADRHGVIQRTYSSFGVQKPYPIVVLVNGASASAAEIIAGAFQDTGTGVLVGTKTYGKATVQHMERLSNSAGLRYTVAKYQTPNGRDINGIGLEPDVVVELPAEFMLLYHQLVNDLKPGDKDVFVTFLQKMLVALKFNVAETGTYDQATERAVRAFQGKHGLAVSGVADAATRSKLAQEIEALLGQSDLQLEKGKEILLEKI
ncbi:MAG: S41 family peptidase [Firmicutes bacterium]|nr:S41 family peptidase [Bacillota bacterium]MCL5993840.1 S41 family peptidase [Bacillota bacterium]